MSVAPLRRSRDTPPRIAPLETLPLFHRLAGRRVVVAGWGDAVAWKAELVAAAGADVLVLAGEGADVSRPPAPAAGSIAVAARAWTPADLRGAALAVGDLADAEDAVAFVAAAHGVGVPVNMIDRTELCDVLFGTVVNRSPVVVGISSGGAAPALGQSVRVRIESVLPATLAAWATAARAWRPRVRAAVAEFAARQRCAARTWAAIDRAPGEHDYAALLAGADAHGGSVTLVGAGPGDPDLLTLRAVRALQTATVILYDDLVAPAVLELARCEARRMAGASEAAVPAARRATSAPSSCGSRARARRWCG